MLYFAYGSNMAWDQMQSRCPSAQFVAIARLSDYRLVFPRYSRRRKCDVASIASAEGEVVWGVVYRIDDVDRCALDAFEGFDPRRDPARNAYEAINVVVLVQRNPAHPLNVLTYTARPQPNFTPRGPSVDYGNLFLAGATYWHLPEDYLRVIEATCRTHGERHELRSGS
ncbi:MAG TPA: gamma-glutamylcyclotransferase family protein [Stellaceae bacterium]|nr:gamma-glutamylcyclotransferase family protein [Stellaceae bacterium]